MNKSPYNEVKDKVGSFYNDLITMKIIDEDKRLKDVKVEDKDIIDMKEALKSKKYKISFEKSKTKKTKPQKDKDPFS